MPVERFRRLPFTFEALRYQQGGEDEVLDFCGTDARVLRHGPDRVVLVLRTLHGETIVEDGCYVARSPKGDHYPIAADVIGLVAEPVENEEAGRG